MGMLEEDYEVFVADTPAARDIHHEIRFRVYCLEAGLEPRDQHPEEKESDAWDERSVPFIVRQRSTGAWVGAMRLVKPRQGLLPLDDVADIQPEHAPRPESCAWELSRISIVREASRAGGQRLGSELLAVMLRAAIEYARNAKVARFLFLANPALARIVRRMQFAIIEAGPACHHRGVRYPYAAVLDEAVRRATRHCDRMARLFSTPRPPYRLLSATVGMSSLTSPASVRAAAA